MNAINHTLTALRDGLAAALPSGRIVTRSFLPLALRSQEELRAGVVCLIVRGEFDYANYVGREAALGTLRVLLIGQLELPGNPTGLELELAELTLAEEVKAFLRGPLPVGVRSCLARSFEQSGQLEVPRGWIGFELEVMGDE